MMVTMMMTMIMTMMMTMMMIDNDDDNGDNDDNDDDDDNSGSLITSTKTLEEAKADAKKILRDYKIFLDPDEEEAKEINKILGEAFEAIDKLSTVEGVNDYVDKTK